MNEEKKQRLHAQWEERGEDAIRADMEQGGHRYVGGTLETREEAWNWLNEKKKAREKQSNSIETGRFVWLFIIGVITIIVAIYFGIYK